MQSRHGLAVCGQLRGDARCQLTCLSDGTDATYVRTVTTAAGEGDEGSVQMRFDGNEKRAFTGRIGSMVVQGLIFWKFWRGHTD